MIRVKETLFTPSLMERLSERQEVPASQAASVRGLKEVIRRDLEALLNTRKPLARQLEGYSLAANSVLNYGLEDLSSLSVSSSGQLIEMQRAIQQCLAIYEPRLTDISVSIEEGGRIDKEIKLHIEATLPFYPTIEAVTFDTVFNVTNQTYSVGE
jgi:type VI secretion system protein ImpF